MRPDRGVPAAGGKTLAKLHREARLSLEAAGVGTPELDARLLVQHVSGTSATDRAARPEMAVDGRVAAAVEAALRRRIGGEPVHRILGFREFYGLRLKLSPETLEPRPDTEILVDALLPFVRRVAALEGSCSILDLGTGSGAIALALLAQVPDSIATGVDVSQQSVATARDNARALGLAARF